MPPKPRPRKPPKKKAVVKAPATASARSDRRVLTTLAGAAGVVLVALGLGYVLFGGGSGGASASDASKLLEAAGCTLQSVEALPSNNHTLTNPTDTSPKWNTSPPTSGPHNSTPAIFGAYTTPLNQAQVVHNLEHGGIVRPVRKGCAAGDGRQPAGLLRANIRPERSWPRSRASARRSPWAPGRHPVHPRRTRAPRTSRNARRSTKQPMPRSSAPSSSRARSASRRAASGLVRRAPGRQQGSTLGRSRGGETGHTRPT